MNVDKFDFATVYFLLGRLASHTDIEGLKILQEVFDELDKVLYGDKEAGIDTD